MKYPEKAIAIDRIDRMNPIGIRFIIPILTPYMNNDKIIEKDVFQNKQNLINSDKLIEIENIHMCNYIKMNIPKELCSLPNAKYYIDKESSNIKLNDIDININNANTVINITSSNEYSIHGNISLSNNNNDSISTKNIEGELTLKLSDEDRYIDEYSEWIVVFIGGDITKPKIIGKF